MITTVGLNHVRDMLGGGAVRPSHIAVGTGTGATTLGITALETEVFRRAIDRRTREDLRFTAQILIQQSEANDNELSEVGLFAGSVLVARALLSPTISKTASIEVTVAHELLSGNG